MKLENLIRSMQRRIAFRRRAIYNLERRIEWYKERGSIAHAIEYRSEVKHLAKEQKEDKVILDNLCAQRTMHEFLERNNAVISIEVEGKTVNE